MIEMEFSRFHDHDYVERGYRLYVMKNGVGDPLYIGVSKKSIWMRWFGTNFGHMIWEGNIIRGNSSIGEKIEDHLPDSLTWKIQLWTARDCVKFCKELRNRYSYVPDIHTIEAHMVKKLSPILNSLYNSDPRLYTPPRSRREIQKEQYLDRIYKEIFEKRQ